MDVTLAEFNQRNNLLQNTVKVKDDEIDALREKIEELQAKNAKELE